MSHKNIAGLGLYTLVNAGFSLFIMQNTVVRYKFIFMYTSVASRSHTSLLFTKQYNFCTSEGRWRSDVLKVTAGQAESNGSLLGV